MTSAITAKENAKIVLIKNGFSFNVTDLRRKYETVMIARSKAHTGNDKTLNARSV